MERMDIFGLTVDVANMEEVVCCCLDWAKDGESRYVCVANVHMTIEAHRAPAFAQAANGGDLVVADGFPLALTMRLFGCCGQRQVRGTDLTRMLCQRAAAGTIPVGFVGGRETTLRAVVEEMRRDNPGLDVAYAHSPPFRPMTPEEMEAIAKDVAASGCGILFVGLGCPNQENWMANQRGRIGCVMLGVGAAFDFIAGTVPEAPRWMQRLGLEWVHRLACEPRRLWRRYLITNTRFLMLLLLGLARLPAYRPHLLPNAERG